MACSTLRALLSLMAEAQSGNEKKCSVNSFEEVTISEFLCLCAELKEITWCI